MSLAELRRALFLLLVAGIVLAMADRAIAQAEVSNRASSPVLNLEDGATRNSLQGYVDYLVDAEGRYSVAEVDAPLAHAFQPVVDLNRSRGFVGGAYWLRFKLKRNAPQASSYFLEIAYPQLDDIALYLADAVGGFAIKRGGDNLPFRERDVEYHNPGFRIALDDGEVQTFYLRIETRGAMAFPMTVWTQNRFVEATFTERTALGAYYGVIVAMFLYNLLLAIWQRDQPSFYYVLHIATLALFLFAANGLAFQYLWPDSPPLANWSLPALTLVALLTATQFTRAFLDLKAQALQLDRALIGLLAIAAIALLSLPFASYAMAVTGSMILVGVHMTACFAVAAWLMKRGFRPARIFMAALLFEILGAGIGALRIGGMIPGGFLTAHSLQIASIIEMLLLSLGLAGRINFLKQQRELAQIENLRVQNDALASLQQSERELEARVQQRTLQLAEANNVLKMQVDERIRAEQLLRDSERRMRYLAHHDALTGLANRVLLDDRLQVAIARAQRESGSVVVMLIDLDHFKQINDKLGHNLGDKLLVEVAERLRAATRAADTVARLSGDEFVVILTDQKAASDAAPIAQKIIDMLSTPIDTGSHVLQTSASIGIAIYPKNGADTKTLLKRADVAMYAAKRVGRKAFRFYGEQDTTPVKD